MRVERLAVAKIFCSIQGEGALAGVPMTFIRLAGCSIGCSLCDTNYRATERLTAEQIVERVRQFGRRNVWITGGEPTDHDLRPLLDLLTAGCFWRALATAGYRDVPYRVDWLSVSPHDPSKLKVFGGDEIKIVPSLNGFSLADFEPLLPRLAFTHGYVQPCEGRPETVQECIGFAMRHAGWRVGGQLHKAWGLE